MLRSRASRAEPSGHAQARKQHPDAEVAVHGEQRQPLPALEVFEIADLWQGEAIVSAIEHGVVG